MKKILLGCGIVIVIAMVGFGAAAFYAYRAMKPVIDNAANYMEKARVAERLGAAIDNKTPFPPPESGELSRAQVEAINELKTTEPVYQWERSLV